MKKFKPKNKKSKTLSQKKAEAKVDLPLSCPSDSHFVRGHQLHIRPSESHPEGWITTRRAHCAKNPIGNRSIQADEIEEISKKYFEDAEPKPCNLSLEFKKNGTKYDALIAGWTKYWNDIFQISDPLNPNLVKALIATESTFTANLLANKKNPESARGLMQITGQTRKILGNEKGELKDHFIHITKEDLNNPSINIYAGIRWLFYKREFLSSRIGRDPTWTEVIFEYKGGRSKSATKEKMKKIMEKFSKYYEKYKQCKNP